MQLLKFVCNESDASNKIVQFSTVKTGNLSFQKIQLSNVVTGTTNPVEISVGPKNHRNHFWAKLGSKMAAKSRHGPKYLVMNFGSLSKVIILRHHPKKVNLK